MRKTGNIGHDILKMGVHVQLGGRRSYKRHGMECWERNQESGLSMRFSRGVFGFHSFTHDMEGITLELETVAAKTLEAAMKFG